MTPKSQNWHNFCHYQSGDWHGIWTKYSPEQEIIDRFKCIRSLHANEDESEIQHQNHYTYSDGKTETKFFGPYLQPNTRGLFLDNCFSWGSTSVEANEVFFFETGFRIDDRRANAGVVYDKNGKLENITTIAELDGSFSDRFFNLPHQDLTGNWQGKLKTMTTDWIISAPVSTSWQKLEDLAEDYLTFHFPDGISVSCPRQIDAEGKFFLAEDWQVNSNLSQRGIRYFHGSDFTHLTLETFLND
jgi:Domain of unknown function (DUF3598)